MVWILHISDLHRSRDAHIDNKMLVESMRKDIEGIRESNDAVDVIIASGDIIQGSRENSIEEAVAEVNIQYSESRSLLEKLVNIVGGGDWEKLVVVPGNHDVCWAHSKAAMKVLELPDSEQRSDSISKYYKNLKEPRSKIRWSWKELSFYEIFRNDRYKERLDNFRVFINNLPNRRFKWKNLEQDRFTIQIFDKYQLVIVGFCSCFNTDHLHHTGSIHPDSIAQVEDELRAQGVKNYLKIAVWHHNTQGGPMDVDYMHDHVLEILTKFDYMLGFHGHQHKSDFIYRHSLVDPEKNIAVISAASLCAGERELPPGHSRGYNLVKLEQDQVFVWARELKEISSMPVWQEQAQQSPRKAKLGKNIKTGQNLVQERLIHLRDMHDPEAIVKLIEDRNLLDQPIFRSFWMDAARQLDDHQRIAHFSPINAEEKILVLEALESLQDDDLTQQKLKEEWIQDDDASVRYLVNQLEKRLHAGQGGSNV